MYFDNWANEYTKTLTSIMVMAGTHEIEVSESIDRFEKIITKVKSLKKKLIIVGNGGSAAIASHISQDILNKLKVHSIVPTDPSLMTCLANDYGYDNVFSTALEVMLDKNDLLLVISSSGNSKNIIKACEVGKKKGCELITLSGFDPDNKLRSMTSDLDFYVNSKDYGMVEIVHLSILHLLIDSVSKSM